MYNSKKQCLEGSESEVPYRRRGRPTGKNRVPLSREERRARNALYERERRNETAEAMAQLAEAVNCDPNISNADLLATVISRIERAHRKESSQDIQDLERINMNLEAQIIDLQSRLGLDDASLEALDDDNIDLQTFASRSNRENKAEKIKVRKEAKKRKRSECDFSRNDDEQPPLNLLTDSEIKLVTDLIGAHLVDPGEFTDTT